MSVITARDISVLVAFVTIVLVLWTAFVSRQCLATGLSRAAQVLAVGAIISAGFCAVADPTPAHRLVLLIIAAAAVMTADFWWQLESFSVIEDFKEFLATRRS